MRSSFTLDSERKLTCFRRLIELGVPVAQFSEVVPLKKVEDQVPAKA